jgi:methylmalonyl-CoA mutase cobalamin-binding subunit
VADGERRVRALVDSLAEQGIEAICLKEGFSARRIAAAAAEQRADAIELCLTGAGGVLLLRQLLRELDEISQRGISIVVRRLDVSRAGVPASHPWRECNRW